VSKSVGQVICLTGPRCAGIVDDVPHAMDNPGMQSAKEKFVRVKKQDTPSLCCDSFSENQLCSEKTCPT
jgi:hypothetical protein